MELSNENEIQLYMHCVKCLEDIPDGISPSDYVQLEVGWTVNGLQVWCKRHKCNVVHIDFEGHVHPANTSIKPHYSGPSLVCDSDAENG